MSKRAVVVKEQSPFFEGLAAAKHRVLLVDYDGTVAPFNSNRHRAVPHPKVPALLGSIMRSCATRLIIVSGRAAHEVQALLGLNPPPEIWGTHGIERINTAGRYEEVRVSEEALMTLALAETQLEQEGFRNHLEIKLAGVALHWRGLSPSEVLDMRIKTYRILEPLAIPPDLALAEFEEGVEIRLSSASKGLALQNLLSELDPEVPVAYLGDDATDEEAFRVLNGRGLSVLVNGKHRFTAAQLWLRPPDDLIHFLTMWIGACGGPQ